MAVALAAFSGCGERDPAVSSVRSPATSDLRGTPTEVRARLVQDPAGRALDRGFAGASAVAAVPGQLIVKLRSQGPSAVTECSERWLAEGRSFRDATADRSDSLDRLHREAGVRRARALLRERVGLRTAEAMTRERSRIDRAAAAAGPARAAQMAARASLPSFSNVYLLEVAPGADVEALARRYAADAHVEYAQPNYTARVNFTPNDPFYASAGTWGQPYDDLWGLKKLGTAAAWDLTQGSGVVVAVVDTGLDFGHPDIAANVWSNPGEIPGNGVDDDGNGHVDDVRGWDFALDLSDVTDRFGHGTHVAGTIAAVGNNGLGVIGVAPQAKIMPVKAFNDNGQAATEDLAAALRYAALSGASVINNSWGCEGCTSNPLVEDAVRFAHGLGAVVVFAAGNNAADIVVSSPQNQPEPIVVAATDPGDALLFFSNFGVLDVGAPGGSANMAPPDVAPAASILSLKSSTCTLCAPDLIVGGSYVRLNGTSMATPHVAGVAALVRALHPEYSPEQVRQALRRSADDVGSPGYDTQVGHGRVNASRALLEPVPVEALISSAFGTVSNSAPLAISGRASGPGFAQYSLGFGPGSSPATFTPIATSTTPVSNGALATWDIGAVSDGQYTLRLQVTTTDGRSYEDRQRLVLDRVVISEPPPSPLQPPGITAFFTAGQTVTVRGTAASPGFTSFSLRVLRSDGSTLANPAIVLAGNGQSPVEGGLLGTWDTTGVPLDAYTLVLRVNAGASFSEETRLVAVDPQLHPGWPVNAGGGFAEDQPTIADVNRDGRPDLLVMAGPTVHLYQDTGAELPGWPQTIDPDGIGAAYSLSGAAVGDLDGDGSPEVVASNRYNQVFVWRANGAAAPGWPRTISSSASPSIADVDGDGRNDLVLAGLDGSVQVVRLDGTSLPGWPVSIDSQAWFRGASIADLDGDGQKEIVVADVLPPGNLYVLRSNGAVAPGWPQAVNNAPVNSSNERSLPAVADLDGDGDLEIVLGSTGGDIFAFHHNGAAVLGWPQRPQSVPANTPAVGDIDGDGLPEIVIGYGTVNDTANFLYAFRGNGALLPGWPVTNDRPLQFRYFGFGATTLADVDGDGKADVIVSSDSTQNPSFAVHAYRFDGGQIPGFPKPTAAIGASPTYTAVVGDMDLDGSLELAWIDFYNNVYLWDLASPATAPAPWPMFLHDPARGGALPPAVGSSVHVAAEADAYVRDGTSAGTNFGTATTLLVKNTSSAGNNRRSYLRFPLGAVTGSVASAKLRLFGSRPAATASTDSAFAVATNSWSETGITWNNKPALGAQQGGSVTVTTTARYYEWDVTSFVRSSKTAGATAVSFAVAMDQLVGDSPDTFNSREAAANRPDLQIVLADDPPPTVASPASATPSPVTGTTTALSVLGADNGGESSLTYTWATTGTPPAAVSFSPNASNAAKNSTATFAAPGAYNLQVTIGDSAGQVVTSAVSVTVSQTLTSIVVAPASASVASGGTQQFTATARDQFGAALGSQPGFAWSVSGGGGISGTGLFTAGAAAGGPFTVTAASGGKSGTAQVTVTAGGGTVTLNPVADAHVRDGTNAGNNFGTATTLETKNTTTAGNNRRLFLRFAIDGFGSGVTLARLRLSGNSVTNAKLIGVYAVANVTWGETTITFNNAPAIGAKQGASQNVGLTAAYVEWDVTSYVQAQKTAGATAVSFEVKQDVATGDGPSVFSSREAASNRPQLVVTTGGGTDAPPTVATSAAASPNPAPGTTTTLSVLGADDQGEAALTYTWSTTGTPPAPVTFSANGTNAAKNTTATFTRAGNYSFQVVIRDAASQTVTSTVSMVVAQTFTSVVVAPATATVAPNGTQQFTATGRDQFAVALTSQPTFTWTISGGGTIGTGGLFTAGGTAGGPFTVTAASGGKSGTAQVTVAGGATTVTLTPVADAHVRDGSSADTNFGTAASMEQKFSTVAGNHRRTFVRFSLTGVGSTVTSATLRLFGNSVTSAKLVGVYAVANVTWGETTITWNNAPAIGAKQGASKSVGTTGAYVEWDLTSYLQAQKTAGATAVSFEVKQDTANNEGPTVFSSREAASNRPQLVVTSQ
jgi:subtilisin family serine protease